MKLAMRLPRRSRAEAQTCPACGEKTRSGVFCTSCGAALAGVPVQAKNGTNGAQPVLVSEEGAPKASRFRGRLPKWPRRIRPNRVWILVAALLISGGAGAFFWQDERAKHHEAARNLDQANAEIGDLTSTNARLTAALADAQNLAARRAAVLRRANRVLQGVEPLLSSVDELKSIAGNMSAERDTFASDTESLVADLISLANYLLEPGVNDYSYVNSLIDQINWKLDTVRDGKASLTNYDGNYLVASNRFDTRATALTRSVRALERQLKVVTE